MKNWFTKIKTYYNWGSRFLNNSYHSSTKARIEEEINKKPFRTELINYLLNSFGEKQTVYLEIGVRNPEDNFNHINANEKYSVDPGIEFKENPVDFKITSDDFFNQLKLGKILNPAIRFDVIFIDGLHIAEQAERDINNSLQFINEDGFIILHDCNPPTEYHAREEYCYDLSPAQKYWNGTTWKAFVNFRKRKDYFSCCVDSDWGLGIISKKIKFGISNKIENNFYEYSIFNLNRKECLNLISFEEFNNLIINKLM
ncbi:MAG: hypothetical protein A2X08_00625 [Bacteroidetes bacterium GWA2_32_17]|nr:MAG: hypothetical protein A2X08_00625 [Bacteroidetes bacterium GWA2_32_17]